MSKNRHRGNRGRRDSVPVVRDIVPAQGSQLITGPIGITPPPDHIFKFRRNRLAPAQNVWGVNGRGTISYAPERAEYIEGEGNFVYYYGVPFPSKTVAPVEAIHAVAGAKRLALNAMRFLSSRDALVPMLSLAFIGKKRRGRLLTNSLNYFNDIADMMITPYYLEDGYYCKLVKELRKFTETLFIKLGVEKATAEKTAEIAGTFFEYDNAYRFRPQDLAGETTMDALLENLPKEIDRLLAIQSERETVPIGGQEVVKRFKSIAKIMKIAWKIPHLRKIIRNCLKEVNLENCKMDEGDIYHTILYGDYNVKGKPLEERLKLLVGYHGEDPAKWPPRIEIRQNG